MCIVSLEGGEEQVGRGDIRKLYPSDQAGSVTRGALASEFSHTALLVRALLTR